MSLLSTFAILFETDADKATKEVEGLSDSLEGVSDAANPATEGVDEFTDAINENASSVGDLTGMMVKLTATYLSFDAVASGVFSNASDIDTVGKFSETIGENITELDAWGAAAKRNGGSASSMRSSIETLNTSLADIKISGGGEAITTLSMLGVTATKTGGDIKSAFDILPELADSFQRMSAQESFAFGKKLGLDQGTILLLQQGRGEVEKLVERQKLLGGVTEENYESAAKFNDAWDDTKRVFNSLWMQANSTILPMLTNIFGLIEQGVLWMRENETVVKGFFIGAGIAASAYTVKIIAAKIATVGFFVAVKAAIASTGIGLLVIGLASAFALLYEDMVAWYNGTKSLLGDILGSFEDFKKGIEEIFTSIGDFISGAIDRNVIQFKTDLTSLTQFKDDILEIIDSIISAIDLFIRSPLIGGNMVVDAFKGIFGGSGNNNEITDREAYSSSVENNTITNNMSELNEDTITNNISESEELQSVHGESNSNYNDESRIEKNTAIAMETINQYDNNPVNNAVNSTSNNRTNNYNVNVAGSSIDARGMSEGQAQQAFSENLANSTRMAIGQLDDGVSR